MTRELIGFVMVSLVLVIAVLVGVGYRNKRLDESSQIAPLISPSGCEGIDCLYVSTVFMENPLKRLLAHGMGPRGKANVGFKDEGVSVCRRGEADFLIPKASIIGVGKSTATIDRAVEPGGLTSIIWMHDGHELVTNLRFQNKQEREMFEKEVAA